MDCYCSSHDIDVAYDGPTPFGVDATPLVIFGSRSLQHEGDSPTLAKEYRRKIDEAGIEYDAIVSGGADGADDVAEIIGVRESVPTLVCNVASPAYGRHSIRQDLSDAPFVVETVATYDGPDDDPWSGTGAYTARNCLMAELVAQHDGRGVAIWDGESPGTDRMLTACESHDVPTTTVRF